MLRYNISDFLSSKKSKLDGNTVVIKNTLYATDIVYRAYYSNIPHLEREDGQIVVLANDTKELKDKLLDIDSFIKDKQKEISKAEKIIKLLKE